MIYKHSMWRNILLIAGFFGVFFHKIFIVFYKVHEYETDPCILWSSHHLKWHVIVFLKIYSDLQEICSICSQNCLIVSEQFYYRNDKKKQFFEQMLQISCKSSEILEHCHVKWWLKYWNNRSFSWRLSCTKTPWIFCNAEIHSRIFIRYI